MAPTWAVPGLLILAKKYRVKNAIILNYPAFLILDMIISICLKSREVSDTFNVLYTLKFFKILTSRLSKNLGVSKHTEILDSFRF